jgi:hypothetical protein
MDAQGSQRSGAGKAMGGHCEVIAAMDCLPAECDLSDGLVSAQLFPRLQQLFFWQPLKDALHHT